MIRAVVCILLLVQLAAALPDDAPSCRIGTANVANRHLLAERNPETGTINQGNFDVFINGKPLVQKPTGTTVHPFPVKKNNTISVTSTTGRLFRGCLAILSSNRTPTRNTKSALTPRGTYKNALGCESSPQAGISHFSADFKTEFPMTLFWDEPGGVLLFDISIVVANNVSTSLFYYSQYTLKAVTEQRKPLCTLIRLIMRKC